MVEKVARKKKVDKLQKVFEAQLCVDIAAAQESGTDNDFYHARAESMRKSLGKSKTPSPPPAGPATPAKKRWKKLRAVTHVMALNTMVNNAPRPNSDFTRRRTELAEGAVRVFSSCFVSHSFTLYEHCFGQNAAPPSGIRSIVCPHAATKPQCPCTFFKRCTATQSSRWTVGL